MIRVGFVFAQADMNWIGGVNYVSNLFHAIHILPDRQIEPVLIVPPNVPESLLAGFPPVEVIRTSLIALRAPQRLIGKALERTVHLNIPLEFFLRSKKISVVSHGVPFGTWSSIPAISWVPDFQHRRLPEYFSSQETEAADHHYRRVVGWASSVILSSFDAQQDLGKFMPSAVAKSNVLHFVSGFGAATHETDFASLQANYGVKRPYFHLPNQFWKHKNHRVVADALAILKARGCPAHVVSTGHGHDHRNPNYYREFMNHVESSGIADCFRVLGLIPYNDVSGLMHHSVAVINPSRFEGWSTTVEESKSIGKVIILSSIPVHREQAPERAIFFDVNSAEGLADAMVHTLANQSPESEAYYLAKARSDLPGRVRSFALEYQRIVLDALRIQ